MSSGNQRQRRGNGAGVVDWRQQGQRKTAGPEREYLHAFDADARASGRTRAAGGYDGSRAGPTITTSSGRNRRSLPRRGRRKRLLSRAGGRCRLGGRSPLGRLRCCSSIWPPSLSRPAIAAW